MPEDTGEVLPLFIFELSSNDDDDFSDLDDLEDEEEDEDYPPDAA